MDREYKEMYNLIIEVGDNGQPRQSVTRILQVKVLDVDDHEPRFAREAVSRLGFPMQPSFEKKFPQISCRPYMWFPFISYFFFFPAKHSCRR